MSVIRAVVVDDEPPARAILMELLAEHPQFDVVAECANGFEAVKACAEHRPDVLFLDIQMPKLDGFEVLELLDVRPAVVFVTAYDEHAVRAFQVHAIDYLLKPFDKERFQTSLARARQQLERRTTGELERRLLELVQDLRPATRMERFVIKTSGRVFFVRAEEIDWIEAAGNYVKLHVGSEAHLFRETMNALETRLHPDTFYRIHRSHIVNIERVRELQPWFNGEYVVLLKDGTRLTLSRGYREKLQERLGRTL